MVFVDHEVNHGRHDWDSEYKGDQEGVTPFPDRFLLLEGSRAMRLAQGQLTFKPSIL